MSMKARHVEVLPTYQMNISIMQVPGQVGLVPRLSEPRSRGQ